MLLSIHLSIGAFLHCNFLSFFCLCNLLLQSLHCTSFIALFSCTFVAWSLIKYPYQYIVGGWPWRNNFGRDPRSSDSWRGSRNFVFFCFGQVNNARFHRFPVGQILRHLNTTTSIGKEVKTFGTEFLKFYRKGSFSRKTQKLLTKFQVLQLQAAITPQWLQIVWNLLRNWPSTGCLVSIFTVRINSKFPLGCTLRRGNVPTQIIGNVRCLRYCVLKPIVRRTADAAWRVVTNI